MDISNIQQVIDLGVTGLLLIAVIALIKYLREKDAVIVKKDSEKDAIYNAVLGVVKENTKSNVELRAATVEGRKETRENREAIATLTSMIHELLVKGNK